MTTIAYRDGVIASDTRIVCGDHVVGEADKIARAPDGTLAGACGTLTYIERFLAWAVTDRTTEPPPIDDSDQDSAFLVTVEGTISCYYESGVHVLRAPYYADGSGAKVALGAMFSGATAEEAVKAALKHDVFSGGSVVSRAHQG